MQQPGFWKSKSLPGIILLPIALIYFCIFQLRQIFTKPYKSDMIVICIGNITVGGTGKTPIAIAIAKMLISDGKKIAFLSRGYKGKLTGPVVVNPEIHTAEDVGDEPLLLSRVATAIISKNRISGLKLAKDAGAEIVILDDGLQNPTIQKDISFLVIDGGLGFGNSFVLPSGPLRETICSAKKRITATIIIGKDKHNIMSKLKEFPVFKGEIIPSQNIPEKCQVVAFAGIGNPGKFFQTLQDSGFDLKEALSFSDHHNYNNADMEFLFSIAKKHGARLITTEKDFVRLDKKYSNDIITFPIEIKFDNTSGIKTILNNVN